MGFYLFLNSNPPIGFHSEIVAASEHQPICQGSFPPSPPSKELLETIVNGFCPGTGIDQFQETGCKVCGQLTNLKELEPISDFEFDTQLLENTDVTCKEQKDKSSHIEPIKGPLFLESSPVMCKMCKVALNKNKMPSDALANGL